MTGPGGRHVALPSSWEAAMEQVGERRVARRMGGRRTRAIVAGVIVAATCATFSVTTPSAGADEPGVTDNSITLSISGGWSGPLAAISNQNYDLGFEVWRKEVNLAGGINGR